MLKTSNSVKVKYVFQVGAEKAYTGLKMSY